MRRSLLLVFVLAVFLTSCRTIRTAEYKAEKSSGPAVVRILQISDFHSNEFGCDEADIISRIKKTAPDVMVITGDLFDERMPGTEGFDNVEKLLDGIHTLCPGYFVTGNHDFSDMHIERKYALVEKYGFKVLHDEAVVFDTPDGAVIIAGVEDPYLDLGARARLKVPDEPEEYRVRLAAVAEKTESMAEAVSSDGQRTVLFTMLLAHRPEYIDDYLKYDFDVILSGHAHGGQWRFPPFINGVYAPRQGLFPPYAGGRYNFKNKKNTVMIVSRGLSYQQPAVPRIFNSPELVVIDVMPLNRAAD